MMLALPEGGAHQAQFGGLGGLHDAASIVLIARGSRFGEARFVM
jgi:hypothetical protein